MMKTKLLFICSRNQWRSPTAEALFRKHPHYEARSAGTSPSARIRVNENHVGWSDIIVVMEPRHRNLMLQRFPHAVSLKSFIVLDIPDDYAFMDADLIALLLASLSPHLEHLESPV